MKTMTVRNIPDEVAEKLKGIAETVNTSINAMVVRVLEAGVLPHGKKRPSHDFSRFCGGWSQQEFDDFEKAVADCGNIYREEWE